MTSIVTKLQSAEAWWVSRCGIVCHLIDTVKRSMSVDKGIWSSDFSFPITEFPGVEPNTIYEIGPMSLVLITL